MSSAGELKLALSQASYGQERHLTASRGCEPGEALLVVPFGLALNEEVSRRPVAAPSLLIISCRPAYYSSEANHDHMAL